MRTKKGIKRRNFLKTSGLILAGAGVATPGNFAYAQDQPATGEMKIRKYNLLGRTGFKASDLGAGGPGNVAVLNAMLDAGVNYIDTAESYSKGQSEIVTGQAIKNRDRKSLFVNSKLHLKGNETKDAILKRARKCLERLDTEYLDCMMMHAVSAVDTLKLPAFHEAMAQLKREGKLRFIGVSCHGPRQADSSADSMEKVLLAAVKDGRFDLLLLVYNFIQKDMGESILTACKEKNIGATLMKTNPVGQYLNMKERVETMKKEGKEVSERMANRLESMKKSAEKGDYFVKKYGLKNPAQLRAASTRYCLANPNAHSLLCRCTSFKDVEEFLSLSGTTLSAPESKKLAAFQAGPGQFYCRHACGLCESGCEHRVPVNTIMRYNHYFEAQRLEKMAMEKYSKLTTANASGCENCSGNCETLCPYGVPIHNLLSQAHKRLTLA